LGILKEKMDLCDSMMNPGAGMPAVSVKSDAMLAVIGFLEACSPRMIELVEVAASGALSEAVLEEVLVCNDRLQKQIADIEAAALTETTASTTVASASASNPGCGDVGGDLTAQFDDLLLGPVDDPSYSSLGQPVATGTAGLKSTGEEDTVAAFGQYTAGVDDDKKPPAIQKSSSDDEFDSFFNERQIG
jgi:hypothetical protein